MLWNGAREPLSEETSHSFPPPAGHSPAVTKEGSVQCILCAVKAARRYIRQKVMEKKEIHLKRYLPKEMGEEMNSSRLDSVFK